MIKFVCLHICEDIQSVCICQTVPVSKCLWRCSCPTAQQFDFYTSRSWSPCGYGVVEYAPTTHCACHKRRLSSLRPPPHGEGVQIYPPTSTPPALRYCGCRNHDPPPPWWEPMNIQGALYSKIVLGRNIAFHVVPAYRASAYLAILYSRLNQLHFPQISSILNGIMCIKYWIRIFTCGRNTFCFALIWPFAVDWA